MISNPERMQSSVTVFTKSKVWENELSIYHKKNGQVTYNSVTVHIIKSGLLKYCHILMKYLKRNT